MQRVIDAFIEHVDDFVRVSVDRLMADGTTMYARMPRERVDALIASSIIPFQTDLVNGTTSVFREFWRKLGPQRARQGAVVDVLQGTLIIIDVITEQMRHTLFPNDPEALAWWMEQVQFIIFPGIIMLVESYVTARDQMIQEKVALVRELSTPIMPIYPGILVLPLVGNVDPTRAGQIMETLLEGISSYQADTVIMDITGVAVVDTDVANYLLQAARAARLLGSQVVLVGISSTIAQTMVHLGIGLETVTTRSNLQAGIEYALGLQGKAILPGYRSGDTGGEGRGTGRGKAADPYSGEISPPVSGYKIQ
ncbi:MAG: STAS domain-containing protein [Chloroflexaceae bacterium]|nr:STAS domain-containing protein [Chloroflexaceae bacterium]